MAAPWTSPQEEEEEEDRLVQISLAQREFFASVLRGALPDLEAPALSSPRSLARRRRPRAAPWTSPQEEDQLDLSFQVAKGELASWVLFVCVKNREKCVKNA